MQVKGTELVSRVIEVRDEDVIMNAMTLISSMNDIPMAAELDEQGQIVVGTTFSIGDEHRHTARVVRERPTASEISALKLIHDLAAVRAQILSMRVNTRLFGKVGA